MHGETAWQRYRKLLGYTRSLSKVNKQSIAFSHPPALPFEGGDAKVIATRRGAIMWSSCHGSFVTKLQRMRSAKPHRPEVQPEFAKRPLREGVVN